MLDRKNEKYVNVSREHKVLNILMTTKAGKDGTDIRLPVEQSDIWTVAIFKASVHNEFIRPHSYMIFNKNSTYIQHYWKMQVYPAYSHITTNDITGCG